MKNSFYIWREKIPNNVEKLINYENINFFCITFSVLFLIFMRNKKKKESCNEILFSRYFKNDIFVRRNTCVSQHHTKLITLFIVVLLCMMKNSLNSSDDHKI